MTTTNDKTLRVVYSVPRTGLPGAGGAGLDRTRTYQPKRKMGECGKQEGAALLTTAVRSTVSTVPTTVLGWSQTCGPCSATGDGFLVRTIYGVYAEYVCVQGYVPASTSARRVGCTALYSVLEHSVGGQIAQVKSDRWPLRRRRDKPEALAGRSAQRK